MESAQIKDNVIISQQECDEYLGKYDLTDERVVSIRDNLVGIIDSLINLYLEEFK